MSCLKPMYRDFSRFRNYGTRRFAIFLVTGASLAVYFWVNCRVTGFNDVGSVKSNYSEWAYGWPLTYLSLCQTDVSGQPPIIELKIRLVGLVIAMLSAFNIVVWSFSVTDSINQAIELKRFSIHSLLVLTVNIAIVLTIHELIRKPTVLKWIHSVDLLQSGFTLLLPTTHWFQNLFKAILVYFAMFSGFQVLKQVNRYLGRKQGQRSENGTGE